MQACQLYDFTDWQSLPWIDLNARIYAIQKRIYKASKACDFNNVYKNQNILINCNEAKIVAIEQICISISKHYFDYDKEIYHFHDRDKFVIFHNLFKKYNLCKTFTILVEKVKQYLIYLCIQPEWEARFEPISQSNINGITPYFSQERIINFFKQQLNLKKTFLDIGCLSCHINSKYINPKYIIEKIQSLPYINYCVDLWLQTQFIEELFYLRINNNYNRVLNDHVFYKFICKIICNGLEWFHIMTLEFSFNSYKYNIYVDLNWYYDINNICWIYIDNDLNTNLFFIFKALSIKIYIGNLYKVKRCNNKSCIPIEYINQVDKKNCKHKVLVKVNNYICTQFLQKIKFILYKKDFLNRLRANTNLKLSNSILKIVDEFLQFYRYYGLLLTSNIIYNLYEQIYIIIYSWMRKKYKKSKEVKMGNNQLHIIKLLINQKIDLLNSICVERINR